MLIDQVLIDIILHIVHKIYGKLVRRNIFLFLFYNKNEFIRIECQYCGKRYSRKDSLKHHMKTQHAQVGIPNWTWKDKTSSLYYQSNERIFQSYNNLSSNLLDVESNSSSSNEKEQMENDDIVLVT